MNRMTQHLLALAAIFAATTSAEAQPPLRIGVSIGTSVGFSRFGSVAESQEKNAIRGEELELRVLLLDRDNRELSVAGIYETYKSPASQPAHPNFDHAARGVVFGYGSVRPIRRLSIVNRIDAGWSHLKSNSSGPNHFTGELESSSAAVDVLTLGVSSGIKFPVGAMSFVPRIRISTNYPSLGGGDTYSVVHRETSVGIKAAIGMSIEGLTSIPR
jgi:hypothetical protein